MSWLACRHDPVARLEARLRYRPCRGSFEGFIRLDPIETHHLRFFLRHRGPWRAVLAWTGSTPAAAANSTRRGRPLRGNDHEDSTPDRVSQSSPFQGHR